MTRRASTFKQQDVTRALKASIAAGVKVRQVEIDKHGKIVVVAATQAEDAGPERNEWLAEQ